MFKTILTTISATIIIIVFVVSISLNGILNIFGLAAISLGQLNKFHQLAQKVKILKKNNTKYKQKNHQLKTSNKTHKQKINAIKNRHQTKSLNISKKFAKRSGKKIALSAAAAATIGTAGVVSAVALLEGYDYCDDKRELLNDENILFDTNKEFNSSECLQSAKNDSEKIIHDYWQSTKDFGQDKWNAIKEISNDIWQKIDWF